MYQTIEANFKAYNGTSPDEQQASQLRNEAWQQLVFERIYEREFNKLGLEVGYREANALVRGDSMFISPQVRQVSAFQDSTQQFNPTLVEQFILSIQGNPEQIAQWQNFKASIVKQRLATKYSNLATYTTYVTKAEARREYEAQNTKMNVTYLHIPYTSIPDSLVTVTDGQLKDYMAAHPYQYKAPESRSFDFVTFSVAPSGADSTAFVQELRQLAKNFATAKDDSAFAASETEKPLQPGDFSFKAVNQIPDGVFDENKPLLKGGLYGPFLKENTSTYSIVKVTDIAEDSVEYVRAKHILFKVDPKANDEEKADARKRANEVLTKIKEGEDFGKMAKIYGSDGTAQRGGDLGWFQRSTMVAPFAEATFNATEKGLLPSLVETEFGYHIVSITYPKTNKTYKLAVIEKDIYPTDETTNEIYSKALDFQSAVSDQETFDKKVAENPKLIARQANKITINASSIPEVQNAREMVRWAFNEDTKVGDVSSVFDAGEEGLFVVALLTGKSEKDEASLLYFRDQVEREVFKEAKQKIILDKLAKIKAKSLEEKAKAYGESITVQTAQDVTLNGNTLGTAGMSPLTIGKLTALKKGQTTTPVADQSGVTIAKLTAITPAAKIADYSQYEKQIYDRLKNVIGYYVGQALEEVYEVENEIGKIF